MKLKTFIFLLLSATFSIYCQKNITNEIEVVGDDGITRTVINKCDIQPSFPKGMDEMYYFFSRHLDDSISCKLHPNFVKNRIVVKLYVDKDGNVFKIKKLYGMEKYSNNVMSVIESDSFPNLIPGKYLGNKVNSIFIVNLNFME